MTAVLRPQRRPCRLRGAVKARPAFRSSGKRGSSEAAHFGQISCEEWGIFMSVIIDRIETEILPRTIIPKPRTEEGHRVMGWRVRRDERALVYSIPNRRNPSRPYAKGVTVSDWEQAHEQLMATGSLEYSWFKSAMAECCKIGACNFTMIGRVFMLLGIAVRHGRGVYRKA